MILVYILSGISIFLFFLSLIDLISNWGKKTYSVNCDYNQLCTNIVDWSVANIPPIKTNHRLNVNVSSYEHKKTMAMYYPHKKEIKIYIKNHESVIEIVDSLLHEVTHYKQYLRNTRGHSKNYQKLLGLYGYQNHPMEIEAVDTAKKYTKDCIKYLVRNGYIV
jgi:hypothetical protein